MPGLDGGFVARKWNNGNITPSDTANLEPAPIGLFIGSAGDVRAMDSDGNIAVFKAAANSLLPISPVRVLATGTTAGSIVGLRP